MTIRALLWLKPGARRVPGGHLTQIDQTAAHLRHLGVHAVVTDEEAPALGQYDVVHAFGVPVELLRRARMAKLPTCVSTIYISRDYRFGVSLPLTRDRILGRVRTSASFARHALAGHHGYVAEKILRSEVEMALLFESVDLLLPNSNAEGQAVKTELGVSTPFHVVPNGVDANRFFPPLDDEPREGVVCVGRFEPHKNQLGLIRALRDAPYPVLLVGPDHPDHKDYAEMCRAEAGKNVTVRVGQHSADELRRLYQRAKVNVLASWFETTGLTQLEAALCGAEIVSTDRGFASEYFGNMAWYCDPANSHSIRKAVDQAVAADHSDGLRDTVLRQYTWDNTARATQSAYQEIMA